MTQWLDLCGWMACVVYSTIPSFWLTIHPRADYWRSRRYSPYLVLLPVWVGMWVVLGLLTSSWRHLAFYTGGWAWIPAGVLFSTGLCVYWRSGKYFSHAQLGGLPEILPNHGGQQLVTWGIRGRVRHPVYLAHLCELLAWSIGTGLVVCYALAAFAAVTGTVMIRFEDEELERRFGEEYRLYRENVPAVMPRI